MWSGFLHRYYQAPDHPAKLRLLGMLERLTGSRRIISPTKWGFIMALDHHDFVQQTIFSAGEYEPEVTRRLMHELRPDDVFYDIGANVGYYTCAALKHGVGRVMAFEPDPLTASVLRLNLRLNGAAEAACQVLEIALGSAATNAVFHRSHVSNSGRSGFHAVDAVASFEVRIETVDSLLAAGRIPAPTVMKIDVEGHEHEVLRGASRLLHCFPPRLIVLEAPHDLLAGPAYPLRACLEECGYAIAHLPRLAGHAEVLENFVAIRARACG
jgi:FkbM family methyltransferase